MHISGPFVFSNNTYMNAFQVLAINRFHKQRRLYASIRNWPGRGALILVDDMVDGIMAQHRNDLASFDNLRTLRGPQAKASLNSRTYAYTAVFS